MTDRQCNQFLMEPIWFLLYVFKLFLLAFVSSLWIQCSVLICQSSLRCAKVNLLLYPDVCLVLKSNLFFIYSMYVSLWIISLLYVLDLCLVIFLFSQIKTVFLHYCFVSVSTVRTFSSLFSAITSFEKRYRCLISCLISCL